MSSLIILALSAASALAALEHHDSYYPGGHSTSYYNPIQTHTYGSKYYNSDSYGSKYDDKYDSKYEPKYDNKYEPSYYNPISSYYHSYAPKYNYYTPSYTPYYGSVGPSYYETPKHEDYNHHHEHHHEEPHYDIHH